MGKIKRGDVFMIDLPQGAGSEQTGYRPAVIISNQLCNENSTVVTVAPITSQMKKLKQPTHVVVRNMKALNRNSVVLCEQIGTYSQERLGKKLGSFNKKTMKKINNAISIAISLNITGIESCQVSDEHKRQV